jgi:hypothetical protein
MPDATEAAFLAAVFEKARQAMQAASARSPFPPRFILEGARAMGKHLGMNDERINELLPEAVFYQVFLPSALAADPSNFTAIDRRLPESFALMYNRLAELKSHPQILIASFHMPGAPVVPMLANAAVVSLGDHGHILIAPRNTSWLGLENGKWVRESAEVIVANPAGLRRLVAGLRDGSIRRLEALVDGPHPPGAPGVRVLRGLSPTLGFRTGVLRTVLSMGIPVLPVAHFWLPDRLALEFGPLLQEPAEGIDTVAGMIEQLLRRHPEQWLNWPAASLRT